MKRIQLSRKKGFKLPPRTINCARPGMLGNPFVVDLPNSPNTHIDLKKRWAREQAVSCFEVWLSNAALAKHLYPLQYTAFCVKYGMEQFLARRQAILDRIEADDWGDAENLACPCPLDQPCHVDVLLRRIAERRAKRK